jgi:hypothetical protein
MVDSCSFNDSLITDSLDLVSLSIHLCLLLIGQYKFDIIVNLVLWNQFDGLVNTEAWMLT